MHTSDRDQGSDCAVGDTHTSRAHTYYGGIGGPPTIWPHVVVVQPRSASPPAMLSEETRTAFVYSAGIHCSKVECYKCEQLRTGKKRVPPVLLHFECGPCRVRDELSTTSRRPNTHAAAALDRLHEKELEAGIASGAGRSATTLDLHAGNVLRMRQFANDEFHEPNLPAPWTPAVISAFIFYHIAQDHVWSVVDHYMTSLRRWIRLHFELIRQPPDMSAINSQRVAGVLAYARDMMIHQKKIKLPTTTTHITAMVASVLSMMPVSVDTPLGLHSVLHPVALQALAQLPPPELSAAMWDELMDVWVTIHLAITFLRRSAAAAVDYKYEPWTNTHWTELELESLPLLIQWHQSLDDEGEPSIMVVGTKEKNFHQRNRTKRFLRNTNVLDIQCASILIWISQQLRLPLGPLFRRRDGTRWGKTDWARYADRFCARTLMPRDLFGMTSFRRGLAQALRRRGASEPDIAFLGFWSSRDGPKPYLGNERHTRLALMSGVGFQARTPIITVNQRGGK